ncbi:MAG: hypothetical protein BWK75_02150 [Candidatus Altiarchaeales archaeon A3]|nr:MAG: hypothetical protein BWK75_02150 [Candidatus Altiarchaeales archaeon A3]
MVEKKEFKGNKEKEKDAKRKKMMLTVGAVVVAITMVLSAFMMGNYNPTQIPPQNPVDVFSDFNLKANDVTFYVENFSDEFIFITYKGFDWDNLNYMKNISIKGVQKIEITYIDKKYYIFRFKLNASNSTKDEAFNNINDNLGFMLNIESKEDLLGVYDGYGYGIAKRFRIFAPPFTQPDDIVTGAWYTMTTNTTTENIGLVFKNVEKCDNMSAVVKNITTLNVEGANYDAKILEKLNINAANTNIENPKVELNTNTSVNTIFLKNLMNKYSSNIVSDNISNVSTINFVNFTIKVKNLNASNLNVSNASLEIISFDFNSTKEEMEKILNDETLTGTKIKYALKQGKITFGIDANVWNSEIYEKLKKNLANLTIEKQGTVAVADSCVNNKKLIAITKNTDFNAAVNLKRNINDTINVNINLYSMTGGGEDRYIPYLAVDSDLK